MKYLIRNNMVFTGFTLLSACIFTSGASAQMNEAPWGFNTQNRASIAALIQQVENPDSTESVVSTGMGSATTLICGGDSSDASAAGNASCIILNNSDGSISLGQDNAGSQDANSETTETTNVDETINVDDILSTLSGETDSGGI